MGSEQEGTRPTSLASMTVRAPQLAHYICEVTGGIPCNIGRRFPFEVYAEFRCNSHCKVVNLVDERVRELRSACCRAYYDDCAFNLRVRECETAVVVTCPHKVVCLFHCKSRRSAIPEARHYAVLVELTLAEKEVHHPSTDYECAMDHITSSQSIGIPKATVLMYSSSKALLLEPSMSSR